MIQFTNVNFGYGEGAFELRDVNLRVASGERVCLLGRNGSGKSTLLKLAAGMVAPELGEVTVDGISTRDQEHFRTRRSHLGFIFQNPEDQILTASVKAELAFTLENLNINRDEIGARITEFATRFRLLDLLHRHPSLLSAGEKQRLALAATLISSPKILILDEPTSYLDQEGQEFIHETVFGSREWCVLAATQNTAEMENYDRVVFIQSGEIIFDGPAQEFLSSSLFADIQKLEGPNKQRQQTRGNGTPAVEMRDVRFNYPNSTESLNWSKLIFHSGEVTVLSGPSGSGKTTIGLLIAGLLDPQEGEILLNGIAGSLNDRLKKVGIVFQIPESAIFAETVFEEIAFGLRNQKVTEESIAAKAYAALEQVGLDPDLFLARNPFTLSSGEQRLVAIASITALNRQVMIFDESTAGLDWQGRARVRNLILRLHQSGRDIIVITHDEKFSAQIADNIVTLSGGNDSIDDHTDSTAG